MEKEYLGDSVYIYREGDMLILTTENGGSIPSNEIILEPAVQIAFVKYMERMVENPSQ